MQYNFLKYNLVQNYKIIKKDARFLFGCYFGIWGCKYMHTHIHTYARAHVCICVEARVTGKYMAISSSGASRLNAGLQPSKPSSQSEAQG